MSARSFPPGTNRQMTVADSNHRFASSSIDALSDQCMDETCLRARHWRLTRDIQIRCCSRYPEASYVPPQGTPKVQRTHQLMSKETGQDLTSSPSLFPSITLSACSTYPMAFRRSEGVLRARMIVHIPRNHRENFSTESELWSRLARRMAWEDIRINGIF